MRALVLGEALVDVVSGEAFPGGSPMNVAVGLGRLGIEVELATCIGSDAHGALITRHLQGSNVALADGTRADGATSSAIATISSETGAAEYDFSLRWDLGPVDVDGYGLVHAGSLGAYLEPGSESVAEAVRRAALGSLVSFDPNIRPALLTDRLRAVQRTEELISASHVVKLSDEDAAWLYPSATIEQVLERVTALGPRLVVVTRGGEGYAAAAGAERWSRSLGEPVQVVDTIGAGDAFMSGLLYAIAARGAAAAIRESTLPRDEWVALLEVAQRSAALTVSKDGADPPRLAEMQVG
ncbi:PfkB family carbohydrate kinase [Microbacterium oryzae]|nr:PfkB family carbohydrate kinase [Microbacterium oryzae]